jgi:hypothetical protein
MATQPKFMVVAVSAKICLEGVVLSGKHNPSKTFCEIIHKIRAHGENFEIRIYKAI